MAQQNWRWRMKAFTLALSITALSFLGGCAWFQTSAGAVQVVSLGDDPVTMSSQFQHAYFSYDVNRGASFMLSDVPVNELLSGAARNGQIMHLQLLWVPLAGSTPMDSTATNASIRLVVVAEGEVGIYSGAGYAMPEDDMTDKRMGISLRNASLQLQEATAGFNDLLSPAQISGGFKATRDDIQTRQMNRAASQLVTNKLGKTTYVKAHEKTRGS